MDSRRPRVAPTRYSSNVRYSFSVISDGLTYVPWSVSWRMRDSSARASLSLSIEQVTPGSQLRVSDGNRRRDSALPASDRLLPGAARLRGLLQALLSFLLFRLQAMHLVYEQRKTFLFVINIFVSSNADIHSLPLDLNRVCGLL